MGDRDTHSKLKTQMWVRKYTNQKSANKKFLFVAQFYISISEYILPNNFILNG